MEELLTVERICRAFLALAPRRGGDFAFGMEHLVAAGGADEDGRVVGLAEEVDLEVGLADVYQAARAEFNLFVAVDVGAIGAVVVDSGSHVAPMRGWQQAARHFFEIVDADGVFGVLHFEGDQLILPGGGGERR